MAELNPTLQIPTYFTQGKEDNSPYVSSFMQAFNEARRENSPMAKQQLLQAQQQAALFPIRRQALELDLESKVADLATNQAIMADKTKTKAVGGEIAGMMAQVTDWANADAEVGAMADIVARNWTPDLQRMLDGVQARAEAASRTRENNAARIEIAKMRADQAAERSEALVDIQDLGNGVKVIMNHKTGRFERVDKGLSKQDFVSRHLQGVMREREINEQAATDALSSLYDQKIAGMGTATAPAAPAEKVLVRKDGKLFRLPKSQLDEAIKQGYKPE